MFELKTALSVREVLVLYAISRADAGRGARPSEINVLYDYANRDVLNSEEMSACLTALHRSGIIGTEAGRYYLEEPWRTTVRETKGTTVNEVVDELSKLLLGRAVPEEGPVLFLTESDLASPEASNKTLQANFEFTRKARLSTFIDQSPRTDVVWYLCVSMLPIAEWARLTVYANGRAVVQRNPDSQLIGFPTQKQAVEHLDYSEFVSIGEILKTGYDEVLNIPQPKWRERKSGDVYLSEWTRSL